MPLSSHLRIFNEFDTPENSDAVVPLLTMDNGAKGVGTSVGTLVCPNGKKPP